MLQKGNSSGLCPQTAVHFPDVATERGRFDCVRFMFRDEKLGAQNAKPQPLASNSGNNRLDVEKSIAEIEWLERIFARPDTRRLRLALIRCSMLQDHDGHDHCENRI